jgi:hypothetical protein
MFLGTHAGSFAHVRLNVFQFSVWFVSFGSSSSDTKRILLKRKAHCFTSQKGER